MLSEEFTSRATKNGIIHGHNRITSTVFTYRRDIISYNP